MKQQNIKIMNRLVVLLMLSCLLIGSGSAITIFGYQGSLDRTFEEPTPATAIIASTGLLFGLLIIHGFLLFCLLCGEILLVFNVVVTSALIGISISRIRHDEPDKQRKGKRFALAALVLIFFPAVCLLIVNLLVAILEAIPLFPWGLLAVSLCLAGGALLIFGTCTYRKLQIPTAADSKGGTPI